MVLGTHQHKEKPKSVISNQVEANLGETESISKLHLKCDASAQSSQIQNLHSKLDAAVVENSQMHDYLHPSTLQTAVTNVLQAAQSNLCGHGRVTWFHTKGG